jgi:hypothetical protein
VRCGADGHDGVRRGRIAGSAGTARSVGTGVIAAGGAVTGTERVSGAGEAGVDWAGMVWAGMVWAGMVWAGMVWAGMVWAGATEAAADGLGVACTGGGGTRTGAADEVIRTGVTAGAEPAEGIGAAGGAGGVCPGVRMSGPGGTTVCAPPDTAGTRRGVAYWAAIRPSCGVETTTGGRTCCGATCCGLRCPRLLALAALPGLAALAALTAFRRGLGGYRCHTRTNTMMSSFSLLGAIRHQARGSARYRNWDPINSGSRLLSITGRVVSHVKTPGGNT